ncbi:MAG: D-alanyl-D-alanine carboxypeptidase family protein [bacterium]|nr:D-alanyl-D-alanine carboxypeptidase family protein [bacterium]
MKYAKRILGVFLSVLLAVMPAVTAYAKPDWPSDTGIESEAGIVMDMKSGAVLFGQNIHQQKAPASITKILTALVVLEEVPTEKLSDMVTFSYDACYNVEAGSGNKINIEEGDQLSVEDCLYLLLLMSSNQAANALAEYVAETREAFVDLMNERIREIGCTESHFANPSGLNDDNQYVTAYDMALIAREAYQNEKLVEINEALSRKLTPTLNRPNGATIEMEHKMLLEGDANYYPYAIAGKTGYTSIAGQTLVTLAEHNGRRQVAVTLKSTAWTHYKDTRTLLDFGFARFQNLNVAEHETWLSQAEEIAIGEEKYAPEELSLDETAEITLPNDAVFADVDRELVTDLTEEHPQGAVARLDYLYNDRKVGSVYVYSSRPVAVTDPDAESSTQEVEGEETTTSPSPDEDANVADGKSVGVGRIAAIVLAFLGVAAVAAAAVASFFWQKRKQEEKRLRAQRRRERRRQILEETGCSEAEFDRLLDDRMKRTGRGERPERLAEDEDDEFLDEP